MDVLSLSPWDCLDTLGSWHVEWWYNLPFAVKGALSLPVKVEEALPGVGRRWGNE